MDVTGVTNFLKAASDPQVCNIVVSICGDRPELQQRILEVLSQGVPERYTGTIKSFFSEKQYGFIDCPDVFASCERDVFLSSAQIGQFGKGSEVSFLVTFGSKGQPQAQDLQAVGGMSWGKGGKGAASGNQRHLQAREPATAQKGQVSPGKGKPQAVGKDGGVKRSFQEVGQIIPAKIPRIAAPAVPPQDQRFTGVIKNFNADKKFGFIECAELREQFGRDVFLSSVQIGNFGVGSSVSFSLTMNAQGHPQAQDLTPAGSAPDQHSSGGGSSGSELDEWMIDDWNPASMLNDLNAEDFGADRFQGTIKRFDPIKRYGFIECQDIREAYGCDAFLSDMQLGNFQNGSAVTFGIQVKNGKPQACDLLPTV